MQKVNLGLQIIHFNPQDEGAEVLEDEDMNVQTFFGFDGLVYANQRRREILDAKIAALESELVKLRELRRRMRS